jgi:threonine synthase
MLTAIALLAMDWFVHTLFEAHQLIISPHSAVAVAMVMQIFMLPNL